MKSQVTQRFRNWFVLGFITLLTNVTIAQSVCSSGATTTSGANIATLSLVGNNSALNYVAPANNCVGYTNNTMLSVNLVAGNTYTLDFQVGTCSGTQFSKAAKIFVDWDQNGDFSGPGEELFASSVYAYGSVPGQESFSFTVPTNAHPGATTLRVVTRETYSSSSVQACGTYPKGETQDYTIVVNTYQNDAGVIALTSPVLPACSLDPNVEVVVTNTGLAPLTSYQLDWAINGTHMGTSQITGTLITGANDTVALGMVPGGISNGDDLMVWVTNPNMAVDSNSSNDTLEVMLHSSLDGTYTVGTSSASDFNTLDEALAVAEEYGICGPTVFNLIDTLYVGQYELSAIHGMSATNTVTIQSANGSRETTRIAFSATNSAENYVFNLINAEHFVFKDITVENLGTSYGYGFFIFGSNNITIDNCIVKSNEGSSTNLMPIRMYYIYDSRQHTSDNITIQNSKIIGGSRGIYAYMNSGNRSDSLQILNNEISNAYYQGVNIQYFNDIAINGNVISSNASYSSGTGIIANYINNGEVSYNHIKGSEDWPRSGINISDISGGIGDEFIVSNNRVYLERTSAQYGLRVSTGFLTNVFYNSVYIKGGTSSYAGYIDSGKYIKALNNNFVNDSTGVALYYSGTGPITSNYNNLTATNGRVGRFSTTDYVNINDWFSGTGWGENSISVEQPYSDVQELSVCNDSLYQKGTFVPEVSIDYEGELRAEIPCIGSDEFVPISEFGNLEDPTLCMGDTMYLEQFYFDTVVWNSTDTGSVFRVTAPGVVTLDVYDQCGSGSQTIIVQAQTVAKISSEALCEGDSAEVSTNLMNASYLWSTGDTTATTHISATQTVFVTVTDEWGCSSKDQLAITEVQAVNLPDSTLFCEGGMVTLDASVPGTYLWSNGATSQGIQVNSTGFYHVTVSDQSCESSDSIYVFELLNPVPSFTDSTSNYAVVFTNTTLNGAGAEYLWDFGDGNTSTEEHPIHLYGWTNEDSVAVTVTLTVENVCGIWQFVNDNVWYGNVVSVDNLEGESNLTVYPNPASQMVNLEMNSTNGGNAIIKLLTLNGTVVVSQNLTVSPGNNTYQLNLDGVGKGVYFLEVNQQDDIQVVRLIVN